MISSFSKILCLPLFNLNSNVWESLPEKLEAVMVTGKTAGVAFASPKINPESGSISRPLGKPLALNSVGPYRFDGIRKLFPIIGDEGRIGKIIHFLPLSSG